MWYLYIVPVGCAVFCGYTRSMKKNYPKKLMWTQIVLITLAGIGAVILKLAGVHGPAQYSLLFLNGFVVGMTLMLFLSGWQHKKHAEKCQSDQRSQANEDSTHKDLTDVQVLTNMQQDFHSLYWRNVAVFLGAVTLVTGWFAQGLDRQTGSIKSLLGLLYLFAYLDLSLELVSLPFGQGTSRWRSGCLMRSQPESVNPTTDFSLIRCGVYTIMYALYS
ncbi:MAG: hypothetical protein R6V19_02515 [Armatimonadota bacterium]